MIHPSTFAFFHRSCIPSRFQVHHANRLFMPRCMCGCIFLCTCRRNGRKREGYTCVQTDKRHCLKAFFLFLFTSLSRRVCVWCGGVKCTLLMRQQEETQRYRAGGVDSSGLGKWSSVFSSFKLSWCWQAQQAAVSHLAKVNSYYG